MTYIFIAARRSLSAHDGYTVYVLIVAAFYSADYFASCNRCCLDADNVNNYLVSRCEKTEKQIFTITTIKTFLQRNQSLARQMLLLYF